eukprot:gnl/Trimastix_PCT/1311.p1 GENE.gnl/Trimastix_PCT/1311~~gnl/Trimastix_PCT/1311.p1  ORF type:complete len:385 (+),score=81.68 gnl/Trimastix_PCT/1311:43-1197(+)
MTSPAETSVVFDNGSGFLKAGFSGDDCPRAVLSCVLGTPLASLASGSTDKETYIGTEAELKSNMLDLQRPLEKGIIKDWDIMDKIWHHTFYNELRVPPEMHSLLITDLPLTPPEQRERMTQIFFEQYEIPSLYIQIAPVLSLYANARTTGIVLDSGYQSTFSIPIYEGYHLPHAISRLEVGGLDLTQFLADLLSFNEGGARFRENVTRYQTERIIRQMKEKQCFVAYDYESELVSAQGEGVQSKNYTLPDGRQVTYTNECFRCPEALFQPSFLGRGPANGIHEIVYGSIQRCDSDIRKDLYENVILTGGSSMFEGIANRMRKELQSLAPTAIEPSISAPPERKNSSWIGGAILASLSSFDGMRVTKQEYEEVGNNLEIIHEKCF